MHLSARNVLRLFAGAACLSLVACSHVPAGTATPPPPPVLHSLSVESTGPGQGTAIKVAPEDANKASDGVTPFTRVYDSANAVTLTAPPTSAAGNFSGWTGCPGASATSCTIVPAAGVTVTANYTPVHVAISPVAASATIGETLQLSATVQGAPAASQGVTWSVAAPKGWNGSAGSIANATAKKPENGLYKTPYPAPERVTVTATSAAYPAAMSSVEIELAPPAASAGPALSVDAGQPTHPIDPLIYGMNFFSLDGKAEKASGMTVDRFGGDATSRYNYVLDTTNSASDWFFENSTGTTGQQETGQFNTQFLADRAAGVKTMNTVNVLGWVARDGKACSFPISLYPKQNAQDPYSHDRHCGDGQTPDRRTSPGTIRPTPALPSARPSRASGPNTW